MQIFLPVSDRVTRIRDRYRITTPKFSSERPRIITEFYKAHETEHAMLKRAKCMYEICRTQGDGPLVFAQYYKKTSRSQLRTQLASFVLYGKIKHKDDYENEGWYMEIKAYVETDNIQLFDMMREQGEDWSCYYSDTDKYRLALRHSSTYVAYEGDVLCGYVRCRDDDGLGIYIYDLLVRRAFRGHAIGRRLMERVCEDHPEADVYVMSGVDGYYEKLGYNREGSIFKVDKKKASSDI